MRPPEMSSGCHLALQRVLSSPLFLEEAVAVRRREPALVAASEPPFGTAPTRFPNADKASEHPFQLRREAGPRSSSAR
jgi:hypothetical protein